MSGLRAAFQRVEPCLNPKSHRPCKPKPNTQTPDPRPKDPQTLNPSCARTTGLGRESTLRVANAQEVDPVLGGGGGGGWVG